VYRQKHAASRGFLATSRRSLMSLNVTLEEDARIEMMTWFVVYLDRVGLLQSVEDVVRQTGQQVQEEPALKVLDPYHSQVEHHVTGSSDRPTDPLTSQVVVSDVTDTDVSPVTSPEVLMRCSSRNS